jgi:hypothetical protein
LLNVGHCFKSLLKINWTKMEIEKGQLIFIVNIMGKIKLVAVDACKKSIQVPL